MRSENFAYILEGKRTPRGQVRTFEAPAP